MPVEHPLTDIRQVVDLDDVCDGHFRGEWSGYTVRWYDKGRSYEARSTHVGVRGINVPCMVRVENGSVSFRKETPDEGS